MPTTTLAPPKSLDGISPRELLSAEAGDAGPPVTAFGPTTRWYTLKAGLPLLIDAPVAGVTRHVERNTDPFSDSVAGYNRIRFQCNVLVSTVPSGTRLALRVLLYAGGAWSYFNVSASGPWLPIHAPATDGNGVIVPVLSDWFTIDAEFDQDNIVVEWVTYGGNGTGRVTIGNIYVQLSAATRPPTSEIPEPPDVPPGTLLADWDVDEGAGGTSDDETGNGHTLVLGSAIPDLQNPGWVGGSTHGLQFGASGASLKLKYAINQTLPWSAGELRAFSCSWYFRFSALPSGTAVIFRMTSTGGGELQLTFRTTGTVRVSRGTFGSNAVVVESAALTANTDYVITYTNEAEAGGAAKLYVNAALVSTSTLPTVLPAFSSQPNFYWGSGNGGGFTGDAPLPAIIGRTRVANGVWSAAEIVANYVQYRLAYPGLPAL